MLATGAGAFTVGDGVPGTGAGASVVVASGACVSGSGDGVLGTGAWSFGVCSQGAFHVSSMSPTSSSLLIKTADASAVYIPYHDRPTCR